MRNDFRKMITNSDFYAFKTEHLYVYFLCNIHFVQVVLK